MTRIKLGILGLCAVVVGMMAMSAGAAQGATLSWLILESGEKTATELKAALVGEKDSEHLTLDGKLAGLSIVITCTNFTLNGVNLEANGKLTEGGKVVFSGCKVYKSAPLGGSYDCVVKTGTGPTGTIESGEGKGELVLIGTKLLTKIEPKAGPEGSFAAIKLENGGGGEGCPFPELNQVHGTLVVEDCEEKATTHLLRHLIQADQTNSKLYIGKHSEEQLKETKVLGSAWIKLGLYKIIDNPGKETEKVLEFSHVGLKWAAMDTP